MLYGLNYLITPNTYLLHLSWAWLKWEIINENSAVQLTKIQPCMKNSMKIIKFNLRN